MSALYFFVWARVHQRFCKTKIKSCHVIKITITTNTNKQLKYSQVDDVLWWDRKNSFPWGAWVAQSIKRLTSAQVMISWSVSSSPASGSVLTARSLEPASDSLSPSLSLPLPCSYSVSVSLSFSKVNKH